MGALGRDFLRMVYDMGCAAGSRRLGATRRGEPPVPASSPTSSTCVTGRKAGAGRPSPPTTTRSGSTPATAPCGRSRSCRTGSWSCSNADPDAHARRHPRHDARDRDLCPLHRGRLLPAPRRPTPDSLQCRRPRPAPAERDRGRRSCGSSTSRAAGWAPRKWPPFSRRMP